MTRLPLPASPDPIAARWQNQLGLALSLKAYEQVTRSCDTCWVYPRPGSQTHYIAVSKQHRVVSCSCASEHGGVWRADRPCLHAAAVLLALHVEMWGTAFAVRFEWAQVDPLSGVPDVWPLLREYLPAAVALAAQGAE